LVHPNRAEVRPLNASSHRRIASLVSLLLAATGAGQAASQRLIEHQIPPSLADPAVKQYDEPSIAVTGRTAPDAPLVVFLPGTGGRPAFTTNLVGVIAAQGFPVISLEYDDTPAVAQVCPRDPDPDCAAAFREMRIDGTGTSRSVSNPPAEAIVPRLVAALRTLQSAAPNEGWDRYLEEGRPRWDRIIVSGLSQGAGMAAYIAKQHKVRRVVLFSSPWDFTGRDRHPAPWLSTPGATPPERWQAEYHRREMTAGLIAAAYAALRIPPANIRIFDLDLPAAARPDDPNPYHGITIRDSRYAPQWRAMYGKPSDPP
jgi:predicted esterase